MGLCMPLIVIFKYVASKPAHENDFGPLAKHVGYSWADNSTDKN
jgi:hypothetical protein